MTSPPVAPSSPRPRRRGLRLTLLLLAAAVLIGGGRYLYWSMVQLRWMTITEGQVYKSGALPPERMLAKVKENGIRTVIDLRQEPPEVRDPERLALEAAGVRYVNLPTGQVPPDSMVDAFLEIARDPTQRPLLVHCEHGWGRSVLFSALYRIEVEGLSPEEAWNRTRILPWFGSFKPGSGKGEYLRGYVPRTRAPAPATPTGSATASASG